MGLHIVYKCKCQQNLVLQPHISGFITSKEATEVNLALHTRRNPCPRRLLRALTEAVECDLRLEY